MKWLIASDLHGSGYYCRVLLDVFTRESADRILFLGDILYHGPRNDLPREYAPKEVTTMLASVADRILCVRGNCDTEVDQMVLPFPILAEYALISHENTLIFATHGHRYNIQTPPPLHAGDILLHGHTHIPACEPFGHTIYLNPGSLSLPKAGTPHSYMILENGVFLWKDLNGCTYRTYALQGA